jgi:hypothetical protein
MKKIILSLLSVGIAVSTVCAQNTDKGKLLGFGAVGLDLGSSKITSTTTLNGTVQNAITQPGSKNFTYGMSPGIGYFFIKNFAVGIKMKLDLNNTSAGDSISASKSKSTSFNAGPFLRYYYSMGKIAPFFEVSFGIGNVNSKTVQDFKTTTLPDIESTTKAKGNVLGFGPGLAIFINDKVGIESMLTYNMLRKTTESPIVNGKVVSKNQAGNLMFNMGISMFL